MKTKTTVISSIVMILIALLIGFLLWGQLPDQMASHWNMYDQVDGYISKFWGVALMPLIGAAMLVLFVVLPKIDPLKENIAEFRPAFNVFIFLIILFLLYVHGLTIAWSMGWLKDGMGTMIVPAMGFLFIAVGRMISVAKRNYFIGIRTPWTLANDEVWEKTHQLGGKLFTIAGVITFLGVFLKEQAYILLMVTIFSAAIISSVYSFVIYQKINK